MSSGGVMTIRPEEALRQRVREAMQSEHTAAAWECVRRRHAQLTAKAQQIASRLTVPALPRPPAVTNEALQEAVQENLELARRIQNAERTDVRSEAKYQAPEALETSTTGEPADTAFDQALAALDPSVQVSDDLYAILNEARSASPQRRDLLLDEIVEQVSKLNMEAERLRRQAESLDLISAQAEAFEDDELGRMLADARAAHGRAEDVVVSPLLGRIEELKRATEQKMIDKEIMTIVETVLTRSNMKRVDPPTGGPTTGRFAGLDGIAAQGINISVVGGKILMERELDRSAAATTPAAANRRADVAACSLLERDVVAALKHGGFDIPSVELDPAGSKQPRLADIARGDDEDIRVLRRLDG